MENPTVQIIPEIEHAGDDRIYVHAMKPPTCIPFLLMAADRGEIMRLTSDRKIIFADGIEPKEAAEEFAKWASIYLANLLTAKPTPPTREAFDAWFREFVRKCMAEGHRPIAIQQGDDFDDDDTQYIPIQAKIPTRGAVRQLLAALGIPTPPK